MKNVELNQSLAALQSLLANTNGSSTQGSSSAKGTDVLQLLENGIKMFLQALLGSGSGSSRDASSNQGHNHGHSHAKNAASSPATNDASSGSKVRPGDSLETDEPKRKKAKTDDTTKPGTATGSSNTTGATQSPDSGTVTKPAANKPLQEPTGVVNVSKTIVVPAGATYDGKGQYFKPTSALGDGSQGEHQKPVFILGPGAHLKNVQYSGADGIHILGGSAKQPTTLENVVNRKVGEDAITIDGDKNRAHDAQVAGIALKDIPSGPTHVQMTNCSFYGGKDKIIQCNGDADVSIKGMYVNGAGKVFRTNGGQPITARVNIEDSTFTNVKESIFRTDSKTATVNFGKNVDTTNTPTDALVPNRSQATGTNSISYKPYTG